MLLVVLSCQNGKYAMPFRGFVKGGRFVRVRGSEFKFNTKHILAWEWR